MKLRDFEVLPNRTKKFTPSHFIREQCKILREAQFLNYPSFRISAKFIKRVFPALAGL